MITMSWWFLVFIILASLVLGLICGIYMKPLENMTKEEYMHAVQIMINDMDVERKDIQGYMNELQNYAGDVNMFYDDLSRYVQEVVDKVQPLPF